jgi:hypothetical protein
MSRNWTQQRHDMGHKHHWNLQFPVIIKYQPDSFMDLVGDNDNM